MIFKTIKSIIKIFLLACFIILIVGYPLIIHDTNPFIFYYEGTSFTRDGAHTRTMMQQDRYKIMNLHGDIYEGDDIRYDIRELSLENSFSDDRKHLMKADLIENYINLIETKDLTHNSLMRLLESIEREILVIIHFQTQNKKFIPTIIRFIEFSCRYLEKKEINCLSVDQDLRTKIPSIAQEPLK